MKQLEKTLKRLKHERFPKSFVEYFHSIYSLEHLLAASSVSSMQLKHFQCFQK